MAVVGVAVMMAVTVMMAVAIGMGHRRNVIL
jgi:hypothetical protein